MTAGLLLAFVILPGAGAQQPATATAEGLFQEGLVALKGERYADAEAAFRKQMELAPENILAVLGVTQVYMAQKRSSDALRFLQDEAARRPARADLKLALGDTAVRAGQYDVAITALRAALQTGESGIPKDLSVPRGTGNVTAPVKEADPVAASMNVLMARDATPKGEAGIHVRLAEALQLKKDPAGAAAEWQKVSELVPQNGAVLGNLAMQLESSGKKQDAIKTYREVLALTPTNAVALNNLAFLLADTGGDLYEALRLARRARAFAPGMANVIDTEAYVAMKQGFIDDALGSFLHVVEMEPDNVEFRKHLSAAITMRNIQSPATDNLTKALNRPFVPGDQEAIRALIRSLTTETENKRK